MNVLVAVIPLAIFALAVIIGPMKAAFRLYERKASELDKERADRLAEKLSCEKRIDVLQNQHQKASTADIKDFLSDLEKSSAKRLDEFNNFNGCQAWIDLTKLIIHEMFRPRVAGKFDEIVVAKYDSRIRAQNCSEWIRNRIKNFDGEQIRSDLTTSKLASLSKNIPS